MQTALIFGANGQDGHYLHHLLLEKGIAVTGVSRSGEWLHGDVRDYQFVKDLIKRLRPDYIFHLAANSTTAHEVWQENHETICSGTLYILESVKEFCPGCKVFISGSGLQFENSGKPIHETDPFHAGSPYAVSRIHSVYAARYYHSLGIPVYTGYFFNHESPLRSERHMSKKIASFAKGIAAGKTDTLAIGDLNVQKEWAFAGDIVNGIWTLISQNEVSEAVIGSGLSYSISDWLYACFELIGMEWYSYIKPIPGFKPEYSHLVSNPSTMSKLGWTAAHSFKELATMMMQPDSTSGS